MRVVFVCVCMCVFVSVYAPMHLDQLCYYYAHTHKSTLSAHTHFFVHTHTPDLTDKLGGSLVGVGEVSVREARAHTEESSSPCRHRLGSCWPVCASVQSVLLEGVKCSATD